MAVAVRLTRSAAPDDAADLFERYSERIHAYCLHVLGDRGEAEDAVQTTFLNAHRALQRGVTPLHEYAWLHTIAKNACRMQHRTKVRRAPVANVDVDTIPRSEDGDSAEFRAALDDALSQLPETQRRAVVLREWHGLTPLEIAPRLGLSVPATHALLTRARRSLANALTTTIRGPLAVLDLGGLVQLVRGLKAYVGGAAAKTAVAAAVVTASVGVGGGVVVERSLRGAPDHAARTPAEATAARSAASYAAPSSVVRDRRERRVLRGASAVRRSASTPSMPSSSPASTSPTAAAGAPKGSGEQPAQASTESTASPNQPSQPPEQREASPPAPSPPVAAPVLPIPAPPPLPLPEDSGAGDVPLPVDAPPLPPVPDPVATVDDALPPPPQLPLP